MSNPTLDTATRLAILGVSVLRMKPNMEKRPDGLWKEFQVRRAGLEEIQTWFSNGAPLGVVTGSISGNLLMAEIEGRAAGHFDQLRALAHNSGLGEIWDKVNASWVERSPSGGIHWFYRTESAPARNTKLAARPSTPEELAAWKAREIVNAAQLDPAAREQRTAVIAATTCEDVRQVLAETRGEGGYVVVAPTPGRFHESGQGWTYLSTPDRLATLTDEESDAFLSLLRTLDIPKALPAGPAPSPFSRTAAANGIIDGVKPGDDLDRETWENLLLPHGWTKLSQDNTGTTYWIRPGKRMGISATTGHSADRDRMYVFTTSTSLPAEEPLTKFAVYAHLNHGGNYSAAASHLRKDGWGQQPEVLIGVPPRSPFQIGAPVTRQGNQVPDRTSHGPAAPTFSPETSHFPDPSPLATVTDIAEKRARQPSTAAHSDDGNATLFASEHGSIVRYNPESGQWLTWEKTVWKRQPDKSGGSVVMLARETARNLPTNNEENRKWRVKSLSERSIMAMTRLARSDPGLVAHPQDLDNLPWELNTPAGPVDLKTGTLLPPDPAKLHTKQTAVAPDFDADRSRWLQFLAETFPGNQPMIDYIQRLAGYTLVGEVREHVLPFSFGDGGNGKGATIETLSYLLGDYATSTAPNFLMKTFTNDHPTELAKLSGARMVVCSEINPNAVFDEARMNILSGGDKITARFMGKDEFTFMPTHQLWLSGNHQPQVDGGGGGGFWRRLRLIPFTHTVPLEQQEEELPRRLREEYGPAILAWMIEGAVAYHRHGLNGSEPAQVRQATKEYREDAQTVARFVEQECAVGDTNDTVPVRKFRNRYEQFCDEQGTSPIKGKAFIRQLRDAGVDVGTIRSGATRYYGKVRLLSGQDDLEFPAPQDFSPGAAKD